MKFYNNLSNISLFGIKTLSLHKMWSDGFNIMKHKSERKISNLRTIGILILLNMKKVSIINFNTKIVIHFPLYVSRPVNDDFFIPF